MKTGEIIQEIIRGNQEEEVIKILLDILIEQKRDCQQSNTERGASLQAIHKINKGKNEAIDALSDVNNCCARKNRRRYI